MDEIRKNDQITIKTQQGEEISGFVVDFTSDRVLVLVSELDLEKASKLQELMDIIVEAKTRFGIKSMKSCVISQLNKNKCIIVENSPTIPVVSKREFVRIVTDLEFFIQNNDEHIVCQCDNISAGAVAFRCPQKVFTMNDEFIAHFSASDFSRDFTAKMKIIKLNDSQYIAKFVNLNDYDESLIVNYVFKLMTDK